MNALPSTQHGNATRERGGKARAARQAGFMNHRLAPIATLAFVFACLLYAPAIRAGGVELAAGDGTEVAAVENTPPEQLPDVMSQLAPEPPNLRLRNTLVIGGSAALVTAFGM